MGVKLACIKEYKTKTAYLEEQVSFTFKAFLNVFESKDGDCGISTWKFLFLVRGFSELSLAPGFARATAKVYADVFDFLSFFWWWIIPIQCLPSEHTPSSHIHWTLKSIQTLQVDLQTQWNMASEKTIIKCHEWRSSSENLQNFFLLFLPMSAHITALG
jgi:hypothetical protein